jgi:1-acyl-sn-glycerol-3-phosphate acyltransferase
MNELAPRPTPLPYIERLLSHCLRAPIIFAETGFLGSLSILASLFDKSGKWQHRIAQAWGRAVVAATGAKLTILHRERLKPQVAVYVCNHLSFMDTPVIFGAMPFQFRIVARHDLWKMPFIGWHLRRSGQVPVNVNNPRASISSLSSAARTLKGGMPLFIFPEGGRSESGHLAAFMNGPAFMAIRAQVPLIPMALVGTHELMPIHTATLHPVPVTLVVGEPIETAGCTMKQLDEVTARLANEIARMYYDHSYLEKPAQQGTEAAPKSETISAPQVL